MSPSGVLSPLANGSGKERNERGNADFCYCHRQRQRSNVCLSRARNAPRVRVYTSHPRARAHSHQNLDSEYSYLLPLLPYRPVLRQVYVAYRAIARTATAIIVTRYYVAVAAAIKFRVAIPIRI